MNLYHRDSFEEAATTAHFAADMHGAPVEAAQPLAGLLLLGALGGLAGFILSLLAGFGILLGLAVYSVVGVAAFLAAVAIRLSVMGMRPAPLASGPMLDSGARHAAWYRAARQGGQSRPGGLPEDWTCDSVSRPVPLRPHVPLPSHPSVGLRPNGDRPNWRQRARAIYRA
ncbi:hypothetical protein [Alkalilacustris brevis]|uniref:hypothetical protein n=1 Tax=Alkalilacustris brevis TaxID=2026338 RepID=UPI000E0D842A|nr:hypothetical protein [Alkalilacustris brevis]